MKSGAALAAAIYFAPENLFFGKDLKVMAKGNQSWWKKTIVCEIYPKSFLDTTGDGTGDFNGIIQKLDYLAELGVGAIWLTPFYPSPGVDNGYDVADFTGVDPAYGTLQDFDRLISEAKKRNIRIVNDLVFNHTSDKHSWFLESKSSRDNPKADWYIWRDAKPDGTPPTNWRGIFGGSAWEWCEERKQYYLHTFAVAQPDLNWENPDVRRALYDAANFWADRGVGGFRIDAIVYIKKPKDFVDGKPDSDGTCSVHNMTVNTPGILDFLHEFKREVFDGHDIFTVAEANSVTPEELKYWVGENGVFDMLFEFSHVNIMFPYGEVWHRAANWKLTDLKKALTESQKATAENGTYPIFFENHDKPRSVNIFFPAGCDTNLAAKNLATVIYTLRGVPFIYQGQELGYANTSFDSIEDYNDISSHGQYDLARSDGLSDKQAMRFIHKFSRDNARTPMQWNSGKNAGFTSGKSWLPVHKDFKNCNVEVETADKNSVLNYFKMLANFRRDNEIILSGDYEEIFSQSEEIFAFKRNFEGKTLITVANFTNHEVKFSPEFFTPDKKIFGNYPDFREKVLRPVEAAVFSAN